MNPRDRIARFVALIEESGIKYHYEAIGWLADEIPAGEFKPRHVEDQDWGTHRWYERVLSVYEIDENIFIGIFWDRGHTENQEDSWPDGNLYLLDRKEVISYEYAESDVLAKMRPDNTY